MGFENERRTRDSNPHPCHDLDFARNRVGARDTGLAIRADTISVVRQFSKTTALPRQNRGFSVPLLRHRGVSFLFLPIPTATDLHNFTSLGQP